MLHNLSKETSRAAHAGISTVYLFAPFQQPGLLDICVDTARHDTLDLLMKPLETYVCDEHNDCCSGTDAWERRAVVL